MLFSGTVFKNCSFLVCIPTLLPQILIFNPFINWSRLRSKAKNGSFTLCLHISLCCINNASKSERHKSLIATGWQNKEADTRDWASVLEGVKVELGFVQEKSPHNSSGKLSYYKRRETESACQRCCTEKKDCTTPFSNFCHWKVFRIFDCKEKKVRENSFSFVFVQSSSDFAHS